LSILPENSDCLERINALLAAGSADDFQFRIELEAMLRRGGREAEDLFYHYIASTVLSEKVRLNLIRISGYWQRPRFFSALKKVIELERSPRLLQAAVISIAKYHDRRVTDVLDQALENASDPELSGLLRRVIGQIRQHSPLLALMPGFLAGSRDRDRCRVTVKVLSKILPASDSRVFLPYLTDRDTEITCGAFEILCRRGDESAWVFLLERLRTDWREANLVRTAEKPELKTRAGLLLHYCRRFPQNLAERLSELSFLPENWRHE